MRALAACCIALMTVPAAADECGRLPKPAVTLKRQDAPLKLDTRYGVDSLTGLAHKLARPGQQVLGLTHGSAAVRVETRVAMVQDPSGRWECASPQLNFSFGLDPLTVYVASEFPPGTCAYDEIYKHEMRHVQAYRDHLAAIEKDVLETLTRRFATGGPWRGPAGETQARLSRELDERWIPYVQREIAKVEAAQARIDTPEEYARVAASCQGEVKKRLRR